MARRKGAKNVKRISGIRICKKRRPLNLPKQIWEAYKSSQQPTEKNNEEHESAEKSNDNNEEKLKLFHKEHFMAEKNNIEVEQKKPSILKQLSVALDDYLIIPLKLNALSQKLDESIAINKSMYQNLINAKQILVSCSVRTVIQKTDESNAFTHQIVSADAQLEEIIKSMHKQEDALLNCKTIFGEVSLPLQIMNTSFTEDVNQDRLSNLLESKEVELQSQKDKHINLQADLQKCQDKLNRLKSCFKTAIQEKNKLISQLKLNLYNMKKRFIKMYKTHKEDKEVVVNPMESQILQLRTLLLGITNSMLGSNQQIQTVNSTKNKKENIIKAQKNQLQELKEQNKQKDKEIKRLIESTEKINKKKLEANIQFQKLTKEKDLKINQLMSELNNLKRKHDRWLADKFYQKNLCVMLFEKIKQLEKNQIQFLHVKKFECKKDEK